MYFVLEVLFCKETKKTKKTNRNRACVPAPQISWPPLPLAISGCLSNPPVHTQTRASWSSDRLFNACEARASTAAAGARTTTQQQQGPCPHTHPSFATSGKNNQKMAATTTTPTAAAALDEDKESSDITIEILQQHFHQPLMAVAEELGVSLTVSALMYMLIIPVQRSWSVKTMREDTQLFTTKQKRACTQRYSVVM